MAGGHAAGVLLLGLAMSGCPADDSNDSESQASTPSTMSGTAGETESTGNMDTGYFESAAAYGTPDTGLDASDTLPDDTDSTTGATTGTDTDGTVSTTGDTGSTGLEPDYGVPTTSGE